MLRHVFPWAVSIITVSIVIKTFLIAINKLSLPTACYNVCLFVCFSFLLPEDAGDIKQSFADPGQGPAQCHQLCHYGIATTVVFQNSVNSSAFCHCLGAKFQTIGDEKFSRYLPIFFHMLHTPWSYSHGDWVMLLNCSLILNKTKAIFPGNTSRTILTIQGCLRHWQFAVMREKTPQKKVGKVPLYFLHKSLLEEEI